LARIESDAFRESSLEWIKIPRNVDILGALCFHGCQSLSSIPFKSNLRLIRIESFAFQESLLQSIEIPRNVRFIDGSAFAEIESICVSIESGQERFSVQNDFLIDAIDHSLSTTVNDFHPFQ
jgi:hypothetical protein